MGAEIAGYRQLSAEDLANIQAVKEMEERCLRLTDGLKAQIGPDPRSIAVGITHFNTAFMWLTRSIAQPGRISLDEDEESFNTEEDDAEIGTDGRLSPSGDE